jgi:hypothetical protein
MVFQGRVVNGVVTLADGVHLPEGREVTVIVMPQEATQSHGVLDIPTFSVGAVLRPPSAHDDLLEEMLEGRS